MRITSGYLKNKVIKSKKGYSTRPTLERIKEAIFSIIYDKIENAIFLDLYAGTGNISFEAISRGAKKSIMIEKDDDALRVIIENVNNLNIADKCRAYKNECKRAIEILSKKGEIFDIVFLDAPYKEQLTFDTILKVSTEKLLNENGIIIAEHSIYENLPDLIGDFIKYDERNYNKKIVSFYKYK